MINKNPSPEQLRHVYNLVVDFIEENRVTCPEACYNDRVYEDAPDLVGDLAEVVGYYDDEDEDE